MKKIIHTDFDFIGPKRKLDENVDEDNYSLPSLPSTDVSEDEEEGFQPGQNSVDSDSDSGSIVQPTQIPNQSNDDSDTKTVVLTPNDTYTGSVSSIYPLSAVNANDRVTKILKH